MMNEETLREEIADIFYNMAESELIEYWNEYCYNNNYDDDIIHYQEEFDDFCGGMSPLEIAELTRDTDITTDKYFCCNSYDLKSGDFFDDLADMDDLVDYCIRSYDGFGIPEIEELLYNFQTEEFQDEFGE